MPISCSYHDRIPGLFQRWQKHIATYTVYVVLLRERGSKDFWSYVAAYNPLSIDKAIELAIRHTDAQRETVIVALGWAGEVNKPAGRLEDLDHSAAVSSAEIDALLLAQGK